MIVWPTFFHREPLELAVSLRFFGIESTIQLTARSALSAKTIRTVAYQQTKRGSHLPLELTEKRKAKLVLEEAGYYTDRLMQRIWLGILEGRNGQLPYRFVGYEYTRSATINSSVSDHTNINSNKVFYEDLLKGSMDDFCIRPTSLSSSPSRCSGSFISSIRCLK